MPIACVSGGAIGSDLRLVCLYQVLLGLSIAPGCRLVFTALLLLLAWDLPSPTIISIGGSHSNLGSPSLLSKSGIVSSALRTSQDSSFHLIGCHRQYVSPVNWTFHYVLHFDGDAAEPGREYLPNDQCKRFIC